MSLVSLSGKVALVTGACRGMGRTTALLMAQEGADLVLADIRPPEETAAEVRNVGRRALSLTCDITKAEQVNEAVARAVAEFERIDILANVAGVIFHVDMLETTERQWDTMFDVNIKGMFHTTQAVARQMVKQGTGGKIVNVSSMTAQAGVGVPAYSASKGAVDGFTRACAFELAKHRIQVNAVAPGHCDTPMNDGVNTPVLLSAMNHRIAMGRIAQPQDVAAAIVFLASGACSYTTGEVLLVDGGNVTVGYLPTEYEAELEKMGKAPLSGR